MFFPLIVLDIDSSGLEFINALESEITILHQVEYYQVGWLKSQSPMLIAPLDGRACAQQVDDVFFGVHQDYPTNVLALKAFDVNGDGVIDAQDPSYDHLYLWLDHNKDGECTPNEVIPISAFGITIHLDFERVFDMTEEHHIINYSFTFDIDFINHRGEHIQTDGLKGWDVALHSILPTDNQ